MEKIGLLRPEWEEAPKKVSTEAHIEPKADGQ